MQDNTVAKERPRPSWKLAAYNGWEHVLAIICQAMGQTTETKYHFR